MAELPFISIDVGALNTSIRASVKGIKGALDVYRESVGLALAQYAEFFLSKSGPKIRSSGRRGSGSAAPLRDSGVVFGPDETADGVSVTVGYNKVYATIRDQGGIIRPVRAKSLFIPLRPGVRPSKGGDKTFKLGIDFVLVPGPTTRKTFIKQVGNRYFTSTVEELAPQAEEAVGKRINQLMKARLPGV